jgi:hypothetical protein
MTWFEPLPQFAANKWSKNEPLDDIATFRLQKSVSLIS